MYKYFTEDEMKCTHCGSYEMDHDFMQKLDQLREDMGFVFPITSGYRCEKHPIEARKSKAGAHSTGQAIDIGVRGEKAHILLDAALQAGFTGIGINQKGSNGRFIHLDDIRDVPIIPEITKVIEVIEGFEVTSLYKVSDFIRGLINLRGQVLACIDLSKYLGFELMVIDERNKFIVISEGGSDFALCVDELIGIKGLDWKTFQETDKVFPEDVSKFFPSFIEESEQIKLIMKPELFINSETLLPYSKN